MHAHNSAYGTETPRGLCTVAVHRRLMGFGSFAGGIACGKLSVRIATMNGTPFVSLTRM